MARESDLRPSRVSSYQLFCVIVTYEYLLDARLCSSLDICRLRRTCRVPSPFRARIIKPRSGRHPHKKGRGKREINARRKHGCKHPPPSRPGHQVRPDASPGPGSDHLPVSPNDIHTSTINTRALYDPRIHLRSDRALSPGCKGAGSVTDTYPSSPARRFRCAQIQSGRPWALTGQVQVLH